MFNWLFGTSLDRALTATRTLRVKGVRFTIQKINVLNYVDGSQALRQTFEVYKSGKNLEPQEIKPDKLKSFYTDVLMAGVVTPKLKRKPEDLDGLLVEEMFKDLEMVNLLVEAIYEHTYGKKKFRQLVLLDQGSSKSTA